MDAAHLIDQHIAIYVANLAENVGTLIEKDKSSSLSGQPGKKIFLEAT
jgi:hypothetical protein